MFSLYHHYSEASFSPRFIQFCRLQVPVDSNAVMFSSGVSSVVYKNARAMLQKALGLRSSASPRDLCVQFGCAKIEFPLRVTLAAFKDKYLQRLPPGDRAAASLTNPIFLAAVFSLVARKHKVKIERERLLTTLGLTSGELHRSVALVADIVPDLVGIEGKKHGKAEKSLKNPKSAGDSNTEINRGKNEGEEEEVEEEDSGPHEVEDKDREQSKKRKKSSPAGKRQPKKAALTEKKLRQAVLAYAADEGPRTKSAAQNTRAQTRTTRATAAASGGGTAPAF